MSNQITVLTVKQPWAYLLIYGYLDAAGNRRYKDIENRSRFTSHRGEIYIHSAKTFDAEAVEYIAHFCPEAVSEIHRKIDVITQQRGKIIGRVMLADCVDDCSRSIWAEYDQWHWCMGKPQPVVPFPARGQLGLWRMDAPPVIETEYFPEA